MFCRPVGQHEQTLARYEKSWRRGESPRIEDYLAREQDDRRGLLIELIKIDLILRWRNSVVSSDETGPNHSGAITLLTGSDSLPARPIVEDYARQYAELGMPSGIPSDLIVCEYFVRHRWGDRPSHAVLLSRFGGRERELEPLFTEVDRELGAAESAGAAGSTHSWMGRTDDTLNGTNRSLSPDPRNQSVPEPASGFNIEHLFGNAAAERSSDASSGTSGDGDWGRLGDYQVRGVLGTGGMGVVLSAEDPILRRTVAIKLMRPEVAASPEAKQRFLREAQATAAVEHPRVVVVHHVGEWRGTPFLVMPLMAGQSLARRLRQGPPIPLAEALRLAREAADGLAAAHAKGLTHRDVKPANIWLEDTPDGVHVRLLDFGLVYSTDLQGLTQIGTVLGTPNYMAPEQAAGQPVDGRSDLFSLGCVLYELLTGRKAFSGPSVIAVLNALTNDHPRAPREVSPHVPAALSDLTMRLLEKSPAHRPASADAAAAEMRQLEQELAEPDGIPNFAVTPGKPSSSHRRIARLVSPMLIAGLLGLLGWMAVSSPERHTAPRVTETNMDTGFSRDVPTEPQTAPAPVPLRIEAIDLHVFSNTATGDVPRGILGKQAFATSLGDRIQVRARLSRPGYAYLIAFRPDGVADLCFPDDETSPPPFSETPQYPVDNALEAYGLREGTGLWVFAAVASERPLPAYLDWLQERFARTTIWNPVPVLQSGVVWWDDGLTTVNLIGRNGTMPTLRGRGELLDGPAAAIKHLTDILRRTGRADAVSAIGFCVAPLE